MKNKIIPSITLFLICFPLSLLFYKSNILNLSLLPEMVEDIWNIHLTIKPKKKVHNLSFPIPQSEWGQKVTEEKFKARGLEIFLDRSFDSSLITWSSQVLSSRKISFTARVELKEMNVSKIQPDYTVTYPKTIQKYLKSSNLSEDEKKEIRNLATMILDGNEDKSEIVRKIYYFLDEEIQRKNSVKTIQDALRLGKASPLTKAKLFKAFCQYKDIPARIVLGARLPNKKKSDTQKSKKLKMTFSNEVFLNGKWIPFDTNKSLFGKRSSRILVLHHHYEDIEKLLSKKKVIYSLQAERVRLNKYNRSEYKKAVLKSDSFLAHFSLYRLPLPFQVMFSTILLIPLGALVLSVSRNIIGIPTFGIFTPILMTLFFKETSFGFGLIFFIVVVTIGILERYVLDKFYLLAVPRLSIILTLIILLMLGYSFYSIELTSLSQKHLSFFPIVIVTLIIERLSIMITEEGLINTLKTLVGTLVIVIFVYALFFIPTLEIFIFTNPELLLTVIGFLILVGQYQGYRLSEFLRFRDLFYQLKRKNSP